MLKIKQFNYGCWLSLFLAGCSKAAPPRAPLVPVIAVSGAQPQVKAWRGVITTTGKIVAAQEITLKTTMSEVTALQAVTVNIGDRVHQGQILARLDSRQAQIALQIQQAQVAVQQASLIKSTTKVKQAQQLEKYGAISANEVLDDVTSAKIDKANLEVAEATLAGKKLDLAAAIVSAPANGVISAVTATVGSTLATGSELFKLIRNESLEWQAEVNLNEVSKIRAGQAATVVAPNGAVISGSVRQISPLLTVTSGSGLAYVNLAQASDLKVGMFLSGQIITAAYPAVVIPSSAILNKSGYSYIMKINAAHKVSPLKIQLGRTESGMVEVVSGNVSTTDLIAVAGAEFLNAGDLVTLVKTPPAAPHLGQR